VLIPPDPRETSPLRDVENGGVTATRDHTGYHTHRPDGTEIPWTHTAEPDR
jgi:hypothetical protein